MIRIMEANKKREREQDGVGSILHGMPSRVSITEEVTFLQRPERNR